MSRKRGQGGAVRPQVGDVVEVLQTWDERDGCVPGEVRLHCRVHYVRRRGDYQIETAGGRLWWVAASGYLCETSRGILGVARVVRVLEADHA